jgi:hypothetical protein
MIPATCEFEPEVLAAALESRWPDGVEAQLREHASSCPVCAEAALVAVAIGDDRDAIRPEITIPDSGRVWYLAQLRARREAIAAADRPITIVQTMALACATGLLGACFGATSGWFQLALSRITSLIAAHALLAGGTLAALLVLPPAVYFALTREGTTVSSTDAAVRRAR